MTLQEIQYKAQGIIHKWRDDDSAPYIEFVEELAHMTVPEPSEDLEEAAEEYADKHGFRVPYDGSDNFYDDVDVKASKEGFIAGAKWQEDHTPLPEDTVIYQKGVEEGKRLMMKEAVEGHIVSKNDGWNSIELPSTFFGELSKNYKDGDKVRIIVLPKED